MKKATIWGGTTAVINLGGEAMDGYINPDLYCQIGNMNISGLFYLTRIVFTDDLSQAGNWTLSAEIWPTLTIHEGTALTSISNPILFNASYSPDTGLTQSGTVMNNPFLGPTTSEHHNIDGMVFTHFSAGTDPNAPTSTYNIFYPGFIITAQMDSIDPLAASQFSTTAEGTILSNRTGDNIDLLIKTVDTTATSQPLTWLGNIDVIYAPKLSPPASGALIINDAATGNNVSAAISTDINRNPGDMDLVVTDDTGVTAQQTNWGVLMQLH